MNALKSDSLLEMARGANGTPKADNWIDIAGYAACGGELQGGIEEYRRLKRPPDRILNDTRKGKNDECDN